MEFHSKSNHEMMKKKKKKIKKEKTRLRRKQTEKKGKVKMREGSEQYCTWVINVWSFAAHGLTRRNYVTTNAALMEQLEEEKGKRPQVEYLEHDDELV